MRELAKTNELIGAEDAVFIIEVVERNLHRVFNNNTALSICRGILDELDYEFEGMPENNRESNAREDGRRIGRLIVRMAETGTAHGSGVFLAEVKHLLDPIIRDRIKRWEETKEHEKGLQAERKKNASATAA